MKNLFRILFIIIINITFSLSINAKTEVKKVLVNTPFVSSYNLNLDWEGNLPTSGVNYTVKYELFYKPESANNYNDNFDIYNVSILNTTMCSQSIGDLSFLTIDEENNIYSSANKISFDNLSGCDNILFELIETTPALQEYYQDLQLSVTIEASYDCLPSIDYFAENNFTLGDYSGLIPSYSDGNFYFEWEKDWCADYYELEWYFLDNKENDSTITGDTDNDYVQNLMNCGNSVSIVTNEEYHNLENIFADGVLHLRVRSVGERDNYNIYGEWSNRLTVPINNNGSTFQSINEALTWQSTTTYAEEGKSKTVLSYMDDGGRNRQTLTKISSDGNVIAAESKFDYEGRAMVNILPSPIINGIGEKDFSYKEGLNLFGSSGTNDSPLNYDIDLKSNKTSKPLWNGNGTSAYYSENNNLEGDNIDYIPHAQGYPFSTVYFEENSLGRVKEQSGIGSRFQVIAKNFDPDSASFFGGKTTKTIYSTADSRTLYSLFGSNLGDISKYRKITTIDPNNVASRTYINHAGQVVATSIAGNAPFNLLEIDDVKLDESGNAVYSSFESKPNITHPLIQYNVESENSNGCKELAYTFDNIVPNSKLTLNYLLEGVYHQILSTNGNYCGACKYDVEISVFDDDGSLVGGVNTNEIEGEVFENIQECQTEGNNECPPKWFSHQVNPNLEGNTFSFQLETDQEFDYFYNKDGEKVGSEIDEQSVINGNSPIINLKDIGKYKIYKKVCISNESYSTLKRDFLASGIIPTQEEFEEMYMKLAKWTVSDFGLDELDEEYFNICDYQSIEELENDLGFKICTVGEDNFSAILQSTFPAGIDCAFPEINNCLKIGYITALDEVRTEFEESGELDFIEFMLSKCPEFQIDSEDEEVTLLEQKIEECDESGLNNLINNERANNECEQILDVFINQLNEEVDNIKVGDVLTITSGFYPTNWDPIFSAIEVKDFFNNLSYEEFIVAKESNFDVYGLGLEFGEEFARFYEILISDELGIFTQDYFCVIEECEILKESIIFEYEMNQVTHWQDAIDAGYFWFKGIVGHVGDTYYDSALSFPQNYPDQHLPSGLANSADFTIDNLFDDYLTYASSDSYYNAAFDPYFTALDELDPHTLVDNTGTTMGHCTSYTMFERLTSFTTIGNLKCKLKDKLAIRDFVSNSSYTGGLLGDYISDDPGDNFDHALAYLGITAQNEHSTAIDPTCNNMIVSMIEAAKITGQAEFEHCRLNPNCTDYQYINNNAIGEEDFWWRAYKSMYMAAKKEAYCLCIENENYSSYAACDPIEGINTYFHDNCTMGIGDNEYNLYQIPLEDWTLYKEWDCGSCNCDCSNTTLTSDNINNDITPLGTGNNLGENLIEDIELELENYCENSCTGAVEAWIINLSSNCNDVSADFLNNTPITGGKTVAVLLKELCVANCGSELSQLPLSLMDFLNNSEVIAENSPLYNYLTNLECFTFFNEPTNGIDIVIDDCYQFVTNQEYALNLSNGVITPNTCVKSAFKEVMQQLYVFNEVDGDPVLNQDWLDYYVNLNQCVDFESSVGPNCEIPFEFDSYIVTSNGISVCSDTPDEEFIDNIYNSEITCIDTNDPVIMCIQPEYTNDVTISEITQTNNTNISYTTNFPIINDEGQLCLEIQLNEPIWCPSIPTIFKVIYASTLSNGTKESTLVVNYAPCFEDECNGETPFITYGEICALEGETSTVYPDFGFLLQGDYFTSQIQQAPQYGSVSVSSDGAVSYTPFNNATTDYFTIVVTDENGVSVDYYCDVNVKQGLLGLNNTVSNPFNTANAGSITYNNLGSNQICFDLFGGAEITDVVTHGAIQAENPTDDGCIRFTGIAPPGTVQKVVVTACVDGCCESLVFYFKVGKKSCGITQYCFDKKLGRTIKVKETPKFGQVKTKISKKCFDLPNPIGSLPVIPILPTGTSIDNPKPKPIIPSGISIPVKGNSKKVKGISINKKILVEYVPNKGSNKDDVFILEICDKGVGKKEVCFDYPIEISFPKEEETFTLNMKYGEPLYFPRKLIGLDNNYPLEFESGELEFKADNKLVKVWLKKDVKTNIGGKPKIVKGAIKLCKVGQCCIKKNLSISVSLITKKNKIDASPEEVNRFEWKQKSKKAIKLTSYKTRNNLKVQGTGYYCESDPSCCNLFEFYTFCGKTLVPVALDDLSFNAANFPPLLQASNGGLINNYLYQPSGAAYTGLRFRANNYCNYGNKPQIIYVYSSCASDFTAITQATTLVDKCAPTPSETIDTYCNIQEASLIAEANNKWERIKNNVFNEFINEHIEICKQFKEEFSMTLPQIEQQFTLYYYDQAGNLIQTVPPEGVKPLDDTAFDDDGNFLEQIDGIERHPEHLMKTRYIYNSLNQVVEQYTPDAGTTNFIYDDVGRLRFSQNDKQIAEYTLSNGDCYAYNFIKYDEQGRIIQSGSTNGGLLELSNIAYTNPENYINNINYPYPDLTLEAYDFSGSSQISNSFVLSLTETIYDKQVHPEQENLRNRVSQVIAYTAPTRDENGTLYNYIINKEQNFYRTTYSYDVHGNVKWVEHEDPALGKKRIDYNYDLISGNVKKVSYQKGQNDQFYHKYEYDADNRITKAFTSKDDCIWDVDATYFYYPHGPLARVELGNDKVQGLDYYYTLQGWLKGINQPDVEETGDRYTVLNSNQDPGKDGTIVNNKLKSAKDMFGYMIGYYSNDYEPIGSTEYIGGTIEHDKFKGEELWDITGVSQYYSPLYNGNIAWTNTAIAPIENSTGEVLFGDIDAKVYKYDMLNRLKTNHSITLGCIKSLYEKKGLNLDFDKLENEQINLNKSFDCTGLGWVSNKYLTKYAYDRNGNITFLVRVSKPFGVIDKLEYNYNHLPQHAPVYPIDPPLQNYEYNNRLHAITDFATITDPDSYDNSAQHTYTYDAIGNLTADTEANINEIAWLPSGKIDLIDFADQPNKRNLRFRYDAFGNRSVKTTFNDANEIAKNIIHVRDASGNVMATYRQERDENTNLLVFKSVEYPLYGSTRLGIQRFSTNAAFNLDYLNDNNGKRVLDNKQYEISNHLGNVMLTLSDKKEFEFEGGNSGSLSIIDEDTFSDNTDFENWIDISGANFGIGNEQLRVKTNTNLQGINKNYYLTEGKTYEFSLDVTELYFGTLCSLKVALYDYPSHAVPPVFLTSPSNVSFTIDVPDNNNGIPNEQEQYKLRLQRQGCASQDGVTLSFAIDNVVLTEVSTTAPTTPTSHKAIALNAQDYYPFGMIMQGRNYSAESYRFGFNGKEQDDEVREGIGNSLDFGARIYDPRSGKFLSVDPKTSEFPHASSYSYAANSPIYFIDVEGEHPGISLLRILYTAYGRRTALRKVSEKSLGRIAKGRLGQPLPAKGLLSNFPNLEAGLITLGVMTKVTYDHRTLFYDTEAENIVNQFESGNLSVQELLAQGSQQPDEYEDKKDKGSYIAYITVRDLKKSNIDPTCAWQNIDEELVYNGITMTTKEIRYHKTQLQYKYFEIIGENLTKAEARGIEQLILELNNGGNPYPWFSRTTDNKLNSTSPLRAVFFSRKLRGYMWLETNQPDWRTEYLRDPEYVKERIKNNK